MDTLFQDQEAPKTIPCSAANTYKAYVQACLPPPPSPGVTSSHCHLVEGAFASCTGLQLPTEVIPLTNMLIVVI